LDETDADVVLHGLELYKEMHLPEPSILVLLEQVAKEVEKVVDFTTFPNKKIFANGGVRA